VKPTEILKQEHRAIEQMLAVLGKICDMLDRGERVNSEHLDLAITFIREFADRCHHAKEEKLLFPAMESAGIPRDGGPIDVMLSEHDEGRQFVGGMASASAEYRNGSSNAAASFTRNARSLIALLSEHILKEDSILFVMADVRLSAEKQEELNHGFNRLEQEEIEGGKHEEFHRLLDTMRKTYLTENNVVSRP
jgi:hemerythrin-like domain-containing protein